jgi:hypothetical protein
VAGKIRITAEHPGSETWRSSEGVPGEGKEKQEFLRVAVDVHAVGGMHGVEDLHTGQRKISIGNRLGRWDVRTNLERLLI